MEEGQLALKVARSRLLGTEVEVGVSLSEKFCPISAVMLAVTVVR